MHKKKIVCRLIWPQPFYPSSLHRAKISLSSLSLHRKQWQKLKSKYKFQIKLLPLYYNVQILLRIDQTYPN
jgi:hypothetical protein